MFIVNVENCKPKAINRPDTSGVSVRWLLSTKEGVPNFEMRCFEIEKGGYTSYRSHPHEHEVFVLEGEGVLNCQEGKRRIKSNDAIYIAPGELHQFVNEGEGNLKIICIIPKGREDHLK